MQIAPSNASGAVHNPQRWPVRLLAPLTKRSHRTPAELAVDSPAAPMYSTQAAVLLLYMVRNSTLAVAIAWGFNYLFSLGNVLSGLPPQDQSLASFTAACTAWTSFMIAGAAVAQLGASFMPLHFVSRPHQQPTWWRCVGSLIYRAFPWLVVSFALAVGSSYALGRCSPRVQRWKLHFYVGGFLINTFTIRVLQVARRMYQLETVEGLARGVVDRKAFWRRLVATYAANMPMILSIYTAAAYVHGASQSHLHTAVEILLFSAVSLVVKLAAQEAAMHAVMRQPRSQVNRMYVSIAVPTVLIDTQVRILLLRATVASSQSQALRLVQLWGSVLLAVAEVALRLGKIWWLRATIRRRRARYESKRSRLIHSQPSQQHVQATRSTGKEEETPERLLAEFESWRTRRLRFHGAEAQAVSPSEGYSTV